MELCRHHGMMHLKEKCGHMNQKFSITGNVKEDLNTGKTLPPVIFVTGSVKAIDWIS